MWRLWVKANNKYKGFIWGEMSNHTYTRQEDAELDAETLRMMGYEIEVRGYERKDNRTNSGISKTIPMA